MQVSRESKSAQLRVILFSRAEYHEDFIYVTQRCLADEIRLQDSCPYLRRGHTVLTVWVWPNFAC